MTHLLLLTTFALAVGVVLGGMLRQEPRDAVRLALWITAALVGIAVGLAWLLYVLTPGPG